MDWPEDSDEEFSYSFKVIPVAASLIYGVGILLPLGVKLVINLYGKGQ